MTIEFLESYYGDYKGCSRNANVVIDGTNLVVEMYIDEILVDMVDISASDGLKQARNIAIKYCDGQINARNKYW